jgi:hypothetical protein
VFSGSNSWDFARRSGPEGAGPRSRYRWNPLKGAHHGGMAKYGDAVRRRLAPFLGFCGGAQILALLETQPSEGHEDGTEIDRVLRRNTGRPIRQPAPPSALERAWPYEHHPRTEVVFDPSDPLFLDIAGAGRRSRTHAFPESHYDVVRPDAFLPGGPLSRFEVVATSLFCGKDVVGAGPLDPSLPNPAGAGRCARVTEAFRSTDDGFPVIGAQFHAEQLDFTTPEGGDPAESVSDPRLFVAGAYELVVDAFVRNGE